MTDRVTILEGSALDLPVPDAAFDRAYSQNVIMNIADKPRFYREAFRALRPGGMLALSNNLRRRGRGAVFPGAVGDDSGDELSRRRRTDPRRSGSGRVRDRQLRGYDRNAQGSRLARGFAAPKRRIACSQPASASWASGCARCGSIRCAASSTAASARSRCWRGSPPGRTRVEHPVIAAANFAKFTCLSCRLLGKALRMPEAGLRFSF